MVLLCVVKWPFETWEFKIRTFMAQKQNKKMFGIAIEVGIPSLHCICFNGEEQKESLQGLISKLV